MNIERFHNELAMRLGYERIVNDKKILFSVEESDDPVVTLKVEGGDDIRFRVSECPNEINNSNMPEIKEIVDGVYKAYLIASSYSF